MASSASANVCITEAPHTRSGMVPPEERPFWLPAGKRAAVCFTIDDVHPGRSTDAFEAGGDLAGGALGHVDWLMQRHPKLHCTLFVTPDWRQVHPVPDRKLLARIPFVRERVYLSRPLPSGSMRLDHHPAFVQYVRGLPRTDVALHGLHHLRRGSQPLVEFYGLSAAQCDRLLHRSMQIFHRAGLQFSPGLCPPVWHFSNDLGEAMIDNGLSWIASARDLDTPIHFSAVTAGSGLRNVSLIYPQVIMNGRLVHLPTNFQATSSVDRAIAIVKAGGLLSVKAHITKHLPGHTLLDGLDQHYRNYLHRLFTELDRRFGDELWWPSMDEIARRMTSPKNVPVAVPNARVAPVQQLIAVAS